MNAALAGDGCLRFAATEDSIAWAKAAAGYAADLIADQQADRRHGGTWLPGIDVLPNDGAGAVDGVAFDGPWRGHLPEMGRLHRAQLSVVLPGYPKQDPQESDAAHRFRRIRGAAHVDGILPVGPDRRRYAREYHAYILGIALDDCPAAPTLYWPGAHLRMQKVIAEAIGTRGPWDVDLTEVYQATRRAILDKVAPVPIGMRMGEAVLLHRFMLHGTAPWDPGLTDHPARAVAFFRPVFGDTDAWLRWP